MKPLSHDDVRIHAKLFAFRHRLRQNPADEEAAHEFAAQHWRRFKDVALDYLAVKLAIAEAEAVEMKTGHPCPVGSSVQSHQLPAELTDAAGRDSELFGHVTGSRSGFEAFDENPLAVRGVV